MYLGIRSFLHHRKISSSLKIVNSHISIISFISHIQTSLVLEMTAYLNSIQPDLSDSDSDQLDESRFLKIRMTGVMRKVSQLVFCTKPESAVISALLDQHSVGTEIIPDIGSISYIGNSAFVLLESTKYRFAISDLVESYEHLIVLTSKHGRSDICSVMSTNPKFNCAKRGLSLEGLPAFLVTDALKDGKQATALINVHSSIRVEFDGLWALWESLIKISSSDLPELDMSKTADRFRRDSPLNTKIPLYS